MVRRDPGQGRRRWQRTAITVVAIGLVVLVYLGAGRVLERWRSLGVFEPRDAGSTRAERSERDVASIPETPEPTPRPSRPRRETQPTPRIDEPAIEPPPTVTTEPSREPRRPDLAGLRNGILAGRTVDASGEPVPFAEVRLWTAAKVLPSVDWHRPHRTTSADADGYFALDELAGSASGTPWFTLVAESAQHRSVHAISGSLAPDDVAAGMTMQMHARWDLPGEVFVPDGASPSNLEILAQSEGTLAMNVRRGAVHRGVGVTSLPQIRSRTDSSGRFHLPLTPEKWLLTIRHPSYPAHIEWVWDEPFIDVWFEVGLTFAGRVTDGDGEPIAGARVYYWNPDESRGPTTTDTNGEYTLEGIYRDDTGSLAFVGPDHAPKVLSVSTESDAEILRHDATLVPGRRLEGVVLHANGAPARGRVVHLLTGMHERMRLGLDHDAKTDAAGRFAFDRLTETALELVGLQDGTAYPEARIVAEPGTDEVVLRITR